MKAVVTRISRSPPPRRGDTSPASRRAGRAGCAARRRRTARRCRNRRRTGRLFFSAQSANAPAKGVGASASPRLRGAKPREPEQVREPAASGPSSPAPGLWNAVSEGQPRDGVDELARTKPAALGFTRPRSARNSPAVRAIRRDRPAPSPAGRRRPPPAVPRVPRERAGPPPRAPSANRQARLAETSAIATLTPAA